VYYYQIKKCILFNNQKNLDTQITEIASHAKFSKSGVPFNTTPTKNAIKIHLLPVTITYYYYVILLLIRYFISQVLCVVLKLAVL